MENEFERQKPQNEASKQADSTPPITEYGQEFADMLRRAANLLEAGDRDNYTIEIALVVAQVLQDGHGHVARVLGASGTKESAATIQHLVGKMKLAQRNRRTEGGDHAPDK